MMFMLIKCIIPNRVQNTCGMGNSSEFGNFLINSCADTFQIATPRDSICRSGMTKVIRNDCMYA